MQENNHGSLQIISEYYQLPCPARGSTIKFHPLEHLHPLEYQRPDETVLHIGGSTIDLKSCSTGLEMAEVCFLCYILNQTIDLEYINIYLVRFRCLLGF